MQNEFLPRLKSVLDRISIEWLLSILTGILLLFYGATYLVAFSQNSLCNDEIYSLDHFALKSPLVCLTEYPAANNHILHNFLCSFWMKDPSPSPLPFRMLSFAAMGATVLLGWWYFGWCRRDPLTAVVVSLVTLGSPFLNLINFQARGYGMVFFFTLLTTIGVVEFFERNSKRGLTTIAAATVLGTWTVPFFLTFGGGLLLILFAVCQTRRVLYTGMITAAMILLLHLPVLGEIYAEMSAYSFGQFDEIQAVFRVLDRFLLTGIHQSLQFLIFIGFIISPWVVNRFSGFQWKSAVSLLWSATLVVFFVALAMETAIERVCSFLALPTGLVLWWGLRSAVKGVTPHWLLSIVLAGLTLLAVSQRQTYYRDSPIEAWSEVSSLINDAFPGGVSIHTARTPKVGWYTRFLGNQFPVIKHGDLSELESGTQVYCDRLKTSNPSSPTDIGMHPNLIQVDFEETSSAAHRVVFLPPRNRGLVINEVKPKPGTTSGNTFVVDLTLAIDSLTDPKSVLRVYAHNLKTGRSPKVSLFNPVTQKWGREMVWSGRRDGQLLSLPISQINGTERLSLTLYLSGNEGDTVPGLALWCGADLIP